MSQIRSTAAIILAAGSSSRMGGGRHKLLLPLGGRPVLTHVLEATLASQARPIVVVLGHQAEPLQRALAHVPSGASVATEDFLAPHLAHRQGIYHLAPGIGGKHYIVVNATTPVTSGVRSRESGVGANSQRNNGAYVVFSLPTKK